MADKPSGLTGAETSTSASHSASLQGFGPYRFLQRLGEGGMGEVWLAEQIRPIRRQVAIKVIKAGMDSAQVIARFEAERQALAVMDHPAIAKVSEGGTTPEGRPYFAMEYVRGEAITTYCDRHQLSIDQRLELFIQLCDGVQHAHQKGVIHRDLKPSNVLVSVSDDRAVPRIIDFGIAKAVAQPLTDRPLFTEFGGFVGTPEYMSPEQAGLSPVDVDTRSDIYSLGVVLYQLLVDKLPFDRETLRNAAIEEIRRTIREKDPPRPSTRISSTREDLVSTAERRGLQPARLLRLLKGDLDWITMKALEKDRTRRYQTANGLGLDVRRHLNNEPVSAGPPSAVYRTGKFVRRHRWGVAAGTTMVTLLVAFGIVTLYQAGRIARERDRANQEAATAARVADFLVGLFKVSDPSEARGNTLTARELLDRGAKDLEGTLRDQPPVLARLQETIGLVYMGLGLYGQATPLLQSAAEAYGRLFGPDNEDVLKAQHELANLYWYEGKYPDAERIYVNVAQRRQERLGAEHPDTLKVNFDLAGLYIMQKRYDQAEPLALRTMELQRRVLGPEHPDTLASMSNIQSMYLKQKRYSEVEPIAVNVLNVRRRLLGSDDPQTLIAIHNVAVLYDVLGRNAESEKLFLEAISGRTQVLGPSHPRTAISNLALAKLYAKEARYSDSEELAVAGYEAYVTSLGTQDQRTLDAGTQVADLYLAWGKNQKAAEWRAKVDSDSNSLR